MRVAGAIGLLAASAASASAGYAIKTKVQSDADGYRYTWTVYNQDQRPGLDGFVIEVPVETRVLSHTVPPPYSNGHGDAYWIMNETVDAQVDPHDGQAWLPAAAPGKKWLIWGGVQPSSVYPAERTVVFSLTTDASVAPGAVAGTATSYTPQNDPHFYFPFHSEVMGPSVGNADVKGASSARVNARATDAYYYTLLSTNRYESITNVPSGPIESATRLAVALFAGTTIDGVLGQTYGIQYNTNLSEASAWHGLANVTLIVPNQFWIDSQPAAGPQRYYRVVPGPIAIP